MWDAIVVGAGPVGGLMARRLAEHNLRVLILEEHSEVGRPFQCAGLVNPGAMEIVDLQSSILTTIDGAIMHSPSGVTIQIGVRGHPRTYAVCRKLFDQGVVRQALDAGAELRLDSRAFALTEIDGGWAVRFEHRGVEHTEMTSLLIGADGAHSWVRRTLKMGFPKEQLIGYQIEAVGFSTEEGFLEMFTGSDIAPGLFAWAVPSGETYRIGTWVRASDLGNRRAIDLHRALLSSPVHGHRFENIGVVAQHCGPLPCGMVRRPWAGHALVVGDAAGLAKPTTGGGIGPGFNQVEAIIPSLVKAIQGGSLSASALRRVMRPTVKIGKELERSRILRNVFVTDRTPGELDDVFRSFAKPEVLALINKEGDIEHPVRLGMSMLRRVPEFRRLATKATWALLTKRS